MRHISRALLIAGAVMAARMVRPAHAATLAEAIRHWTGMTADVQGEGEQVRVGLPPGSPVRDFTARARPEQRADGAGWQLSDVVQPMPLRLEGGGRMAMRAQQSAAWLGDSSASANGRYDGIAVDDGDTHLRLDHARIAVVAAQGPATLDIDLAGLHAIGAAPGVAGLLPQHATLHGHTTTDAVNALVAMFSGEGNVGGNAPVTLDALSFDVGPAQFTGTGTVTFLSPHDRRGEMVVSAAHFSDLLNQMPTSGPAVKLYPVMMILRGLAEKRDGRLQWVAAFEGRQILVNGIDIAPFL